MCPFCGLVEGDVSDPGNRCELTDLVHQDEDVIVFMACDGFGPHEGHAMISPARHYETLYDLPDAVLQKIALMARHVAVAMKAAWAPEGVSTRQHNEPAGGQDVWHLHVHVLPRHPGDDLYRRHHEGRWVELDERRGYAELLRSTLGLPVDLSAARR